MRRLPGGVLHQRLATGQVEHRPALVGEVDLVLAVGHIDPVRQEEIIAHQHFGIIQVEVAELQADVFDFLVADLHGGEGRRPQLHRMVARPVEGAGWYDARRIRLEPRASRRRKREHRTLGSGIKHRPDLLAIHNDRADGAIDPVARRPFEADHGDRLAGRGPISQVVAATSLRVHQADCGMGQIVFHVRDPEQILP